MISQSRSRMGLHTPVGQALTACQRTDRAFDEGYPNRRRQRAKSAKLYSDALGITNQAILGHVRHLGERLRWFVFLKAMPSSKFFRIERYAGGSKRFILARIAMERSGDHRVLEIVGDFPTCELAFAKARRLYAQEQAEIDSAAESIEGDLQEDDCLA